MEAFGACCRSAKPRGRLGGRRSREATQAEPSSEASSVQSGSPSPSPGPSLSDRMTSPTEPGSLASKEGELQEEANELTAIERKIALLTETDPDDVARDEAEAAVTADPLDGYRLVDVCAIENLICGLLCPSCFKADLKLVERSKGVHLRFVVVCPRCGDIADSPHSSTIEDSKQNELAARVVLSSRDCGIGHTKLANFFAHMNMPRPMHLKSFQELAVKVHDASMLAAINCMKQAAQVVRTTSSAANSEDLLDVCVTFDGTWHKRGHTSHFGVGVVIEIETGLVLDFAVISNYCHGCSLGPKEDSDEYEAWLEKHQLTCQKNFGGSANAMEVQAAIKIFSRSITQHSLQYTRMLCDGDSKSYTSVAALDLYDTQIQKEDCVNHVAKRMYSALDTLKKSTKGLGGRGKLTNVVMKRLTNYYACALKDNAPDVRCMQRGVMATLMHSYSTDEEPRHVACPKGQQSWCHFNRHLALKAAGKPSQSKPHRPAFSREVAKHLVPVYNRLAHKDLLLRCSRMKTQNANESFNALIWKRCPKTEFASQRTVETSVALAVLEFNLGPKGFEKVLTELNIKPGSHQKQHSSEAARAKISKAQLKAQGSSKQAQKRRKMEAITKAQQDLAVEGTSYAPGAF